jgi:hypothetical protein
MEAAGGGSAWSFYMRRVGRRGLGRLRRGGSEIDTKRERERERGREREREREREKARE